MQSRLAVAELKQAPDSIVIALAAAGDDSAFTEVLRRRQVRVRKFMYHLCRNPALGDDLAQQVFLTAWRSLHQLRNAAAFDGWLKRIMVTTWLEEVRRGRLAATDVVDPAELIDAADSNDLVHGARQNSVAARADMRMDLDAALATLPPVMRLCVVLAYNEGLSHPEIVTLTSLPLGTVKSHISRGAAHLREILSDYER